MDSKIEILIFLFPYIQYKLIHSAQIQGVYCESEIQNLRLNKAEERADNLEKRADNLEKHLAEERECLEKCLAQERERTD